MAAQNKYRTLAWIIAILVATNLSMAITFLYHKQQDKKELEQAADAKFEMPAQQRTRFFREQLNLDLMQVEDFRELNRNFNRNAWQINHSLERLRIEMVNELGRETPDEKKLKGISGEIGDLHARLKEVTIEYYLALKEVCNDEQQKKLNELFISVLQKNEDVRLPQGGRRYRNNWQLNN